MARAAGILTPRGGLASHAAVVARGWGIPAVVGAAAVEVARGPRRHRRPDAGRGRHDHDRRRDRRGLRRRRGRVDRGRAGGATLLGWAARAGHSDRRRLRRPRRPAARPPADAAPRGGPPGSRPTTACAPSRQGLRAGRGRRRRALSRPDDGQPVLDRLVADGLAEIAAGSFRLTGRQGRGPRALAEAEREPGARRSDRGTRRVPRPRPPDEGHRDRVADPRGGRRPRSSTTTPTPPTTPGPRPARGAARRRGRLARRRSAGLPAPGRLRRPTRPRLEQPPPATAVRGVTARRQLPRRSGSSCTRT